MTSILQQTALLPAGCQPWNLNVVASSGSNFVYCATLAVYIYEYNSDFGMYKLKSINACHSKTVTCISWSKDNTSLFATGGADEKIFVWDVNLQKCVHNREKIGYSPVCIEWIPEKDSGNVLAFCGKQGPVQMWNIKSNSVSTVDSTNNFDSEITLFRWHHSDPSRFVFGHTDGSLSLYNSGKRNKHVLKNGSSSQKIVDPVLEAIWDPLSSDYLLVARKLSGVQIVDVKAQTVINRFNLPSKVISTITVSWIKSAPGMFVTGDLEAGVLRLWSVSQSVPLESINLKLTGFQCLSVLDASVSDINNRVSNVRKNSIEFFRFRSNSLSSTASRSHSVPPAKIVCAFVDGGIGLFNLQMKKWEFLRDQGHIETIFDCKFKSADPKILATASFDGMVKIWSAVDLTHIATSSGNEGVIYSLSWAPGEVNAIACGTRRRGVFIWDINKNKIIRRFKEHGNFTVYCVAWNHLDPQLLASCSDDRNCVVRKLDNKDVLVFKHPDAAFGCDWNALDKNLLATGCNDGVVRVWSITSDSSEPWCSFKGHTSKVFHVRWHPLLKNILCSGSDDKIIRVWETTSNVCTAMLSGHTSSVRGLCWNYEIPYLLASGSWDSSLRLWDVRDGSCIDTVSDHGADIYGVASHPRSPFTLATSSRDSTVRTWSLSSITKKLFVELVAGVDCSNCINKPEVVMQREHPLKLSGHLSNDILSRIQSKKNQDFIKLKSFSEFFGSSSKLENMWDLCSVIRGHSESSLSPSYKDGILHTKHLTKYKSAEARAIELAQTRKESIASQQKSRENNLLRVAQLYLKLGDVKHYCDILVELGQWERALSLAPAVSQSYWTELATRYAEILRKDDEDDAFTFYLAVGDIPDAVQSLTSKNEYLDALLLAQASSEGSTPFARGDNDDRLVTNDEEYYNKLVVNCCNGIAHRFYQSADPYNAASIHLAHDDVKSAVNYLFKSNKLTIALCLSRYLDVTSEASACAAQMLARSCERDDPIIAVNLLKRFDPLCKSPGNEWTAVHGLCARHSSADDVLRADIHTEAGIPAPDVCQKRALEEEEKGNLNMALQYFMLGTTPEKGLKIGLSLLRNRLKEDRNWSVDSVLKDLVSVFSISEAVLLNNTNKQLRTELLAISAYFGVLLAIRRKYDNIIIPMFQYAISLCRLCGEKSHGFPLDSSQLNDEMNSIDTLNSDQRSDVIDRLHLRAGQEKLECMIGGTISNASDLPSHSQTNISTISKKKITGGIYMLDDKRSLLSYNEAIMWAKCNEFSPTSSGKRLCPF